MSPSLSSFSPYTSPPTLLHRRRQPPTVEGQRQIRITISCAARRHHRRRLLPSQPATTTGTPSLPSDSKLQVVINLERIPQKATLSLSSLIRSSQLKFDQFVESSAEALDDLRTLIMVDDDRGVVISCRRSTVYFLANLALLGFLVFVAFNGLVKVGLGLRKVFGFRSGGRSEGVIRRRDRSLGGREVVVGKQSEVKKEFRLSKSPLSFAEESLVGVSDAMLKNWGSQKTEAKLPKWWPVSLPQPVVKVDEQEYQLKANRLIRAIMDSRMNGRDIQEEDVILLRRICRMSGVKVSIDTINSRDSLYRASIEFTLNICGSIAGQSTFVQIDGEDVREFIAGLADNIGVRRILAARMVAAAVAARTRAWLLQTWALEMQGEHDDAMVQLSKLCFIHGIFPPEEGSPEMEMVAWGLAKNLKVEQRKYLLGMLDGVCGKENRRSLAEALGLIVPAESVDVSEQNQT